MERVMLTMPEDLLAEVDQAARHRNQNRSEFVRAALHDYLKQLRRAEFEALLAEGYRETARAAAELVEESLPLQSEAATGAWPTRSVKVCGSASHCEGAIAGDRS